jgi:glucokinase
MKKVMARKKVWVGFDLGGTKMLACLFDDRLQVLARRKRSTKAREGVKAGLAKICGMIDDVLAEAGFPASSLAGIGIGCPGPLDPGRGVLLDPPNLGWRNVPVRDLLRKRFKCPVAVANDVDAGTYGEHAMGVGQGAHCLLGVFPGTGVGGGCVYEGRILHGAHRTCLEIGHMQMVPYGPLCGCGNRGCLEALTSRLAVAAEAAKAAVRGEAPALLAAAGTDIAKIRSAVLADAIRAGDTVIEAIVRDAAHWLGRGVATAVNVLAPDVIVLGGGLVEAMPKLYREEVTAAARAHAMPSLRTSFKVRLSRLGDDAVVLGAAAWARNGGGEERS